MNVTTGSTGIRYKAKLQSVLLGVRSARISTRAWNRLRVKTNVIPPVIPPVTKDAEFDAEHAVWMMKAEETQETGPKEAEQHGHRRETEFGSH